MVINMIAVGEETGQLSVLLGRVADFYEEEVATMTKGLSSILEPLLLIIVGITIGAIVIAIYLPIFSVVTVGRQIGVKQNHHMLFMARLSHRITHVNYGCQAPLHYERASLFH